jgi:hypothetical protein
VQPNKAWLQSHELRILRHSGSCQGVLELEGVMDKAFLEAEDCTDVTNAYASALLIEENWHPSFDVSVQCTTRHITVKSQVHTTFAHRVLNQT